MAQNITFNGQAYIVPDLADDNWGQNLTDYFVAIPQGALQKTGGNFDLLADINYGASFGLTSIYFKSRSADIAQSGVVRLSNTDKITWRNNANGADLTLGVNASDELEFNGVVIGEDVLNDAKIWIGSAANRAEPQSITGDISLSNAGVVAISSGVIVNDDVNASAAISYSKLNLSASIVNADVNASAAIVYSKLSLSNSIVNADINASAAIVYSKLSLANSIVNADISSSAAIVFSKMAALTASRMLVSSSGGVVGVSAWTYDGTANLITGTQDELRFTDGTTNYVSFGAPASVTTYSLKWPIAIGTPNEYLQLGSGGQLQWGNPAGSGTVNSGLQYELAFYPVAGDTVDGSTTIKTDASGNLVTSNKIYIADGLEATPSLVFGSATTTGIYTFGSNSFAISTAGVRRWSVDAANGMVSTLRGFFPVGSQALPSISIIGDEDTGLFQNGSNTLAFSAGGEIQGQFAYVGAGSGYLQLPNGHEFWVPQATGTATNPQIRQTGRNTGIYWPASDQFGISIDSTPMIYMSSTNNIVLATSTGGTAVSITGTDRYFAMGSSWQISIQNGSLADPSLVFTSRNTGLCSLSQDHIDFSSDGVHIMDLHNSGITIKPSSGNIDFYTGGFLRVQIPSNGLMVAYGNPAFTASHATEGTIDLRETTNNIIIRIRATNAGSYMGTDSNHPFSLIANNVVGLRINNSTGSSVAIKGTNTNDNPTSGYVGEVVSATITTNTAFPTSNTWGDLTSISLTAGDWLVSMWGSYNYAGGSDLTTVGYGISTTSGNSAPPGGQGDDLMYAFNSTYLNSKTILSLSPRRYSLASTTTLYLKYIATWTTGTPYGFGRITAVRIR